MQSFHLKSALKTIFQSSVATLMSATGLMLAASSSVGQTQLEVETLGSTSNAQTPGVSLLVNVLDEQNIPLEGLQSDDFRVRTAPISQRDSEGNPTNLRFETVPFELLPPSQQRNPAPAIILTLLDLSGSMTENDSSGNQKFTSSLEAIRQFSSWLQQSNLRNKTYLAVVPFSIGANCDRVITPELLENSLVSLTNPGAINQQIDQLANLTPCGGTNLYSSVNNSVNFLRQEFLSPSGINLSRYSQLEALDKPRLVVIVFSDGFDTESRDAGQEVEQFQALKGSIDSTAAITVHTLGYGDSLETVIDRPDSQSRNGRVCNTVVTREDLRNSERPLDLIQERCNINPSLLVDAPRLEQMAGDRGIYRFPRTTAEVQEAFEVFFNSLRQYEIKYYQADAQEGQEYQIQVSLREGHSLAPAQDTTRFRFSTVILRPLPRPQRYGILGGTLILLGIVVYRFTKWSTKQREALERMI